MYRLLVAVCAVFIVHTSAAEESGGEALCVKITPGLVINYGAPSINRLKYAKVGMSVRVGDAEASDVVEHHLPALQDSMVMLLSAHPEEGIRTVKGKERIRKEALKRMRELLNREEGAPLIEDVLFENFVVQR